MDERDLAYFCKLIELGSYTKTATFFDVTQPTISASIKRLTLKYSDPLITKENRKSKLVLTAAGTILYQKGLKILENIKSPRFKIEVQHLITRPIRLA